MSNLDPHGSLPALEHITISIRPTSVTALIFREVHIFLILPGTLTLHTPMTRGKPRDSGESCTLWLSIGGFTKLNSILKALISLAKNKQTNLFTFNATFPKELVHTPPRLAFS